MRTTSRFSIKSFIARLRALGLGEGENPRVEYRALVHRLDMAAKCCLYVVMSML
jgi:hypothetical protein